MGNLLLVSDLDSNPLNSLQKALQSIEASVEHIILHYAYQIPANVNNVIEMHDRIKNHANQILISQANDIQKETGISTKIILSLGSEISTLKRMLNQKEIDFVISNNINFDQLLKHQFPHVQFINN